MDAKTQTDISLVCESPALRITASIVEADELIVVFQSVDGAKIEIGQEEYATFARDFGARSAMFVTDRLNTWGNAPGLLDETARQIQAARKQSGARRTVFLGSSMGAFNAMALSGAVKPDRVVALSPQWSIDPKVMPNDQRWLRNARRIGAFEISTVEGRLSEDTEYVVVHGWDDPDFAHMLQFQSIRNLAIAGFPKGRHTFVRILRRDKMLVPFLKTMCGGSLSDIDSYCQSASMFFRKPLSGWIER